MPTMRSQNHKPSRYGCDSSDNAIGRDIGASAILAHDLQDPSLVNLVSALLRLRGNDNDVGASLFSISASVVALVTIAGQLISGIDRFVSNVKEAPALLRDIKSELTAFKIVLSGLQQLLVPANYPISRGTLIQADDIVAVFTSTVLFFSELENALPPLDSLDNKTLDAWSRARWTTGKTKYLELLSRLQWHKLTLTLLLTTLNCRSESQAEAKQQRFHTDIRHRVNDDDDLERRLKKVEEELQQLRASSSHVPESVLSDVQNDDDERETRTIRLTNRTQNALIQSDREFETTLNASWVYRRNQHHEEDLSFRSSLCRRSAWTALSEFSLADISILSVIALPIDWEEIPALSKILNSDKSSSLSEMVAVGPVATNPIYQLDLRTLNQIRSVPMSIQRQKLKLHDRQMTPRPSSEISLDDIYDHTSFRVRTFDAFSPIPTLRYGSGVQQMSKERYPPIRESMILQANEQYRNDGRRIDDLADDLDSSELREIMERDRLQAERLKDARKEIERLRERCSTIATDEREKEAARRES